MLGLLTIGILKVGGIHALSSILFPVLLIFAGLLLSRRSYILYTFLCVCSIGLIVYAENQKLLIPYIPDPPDFPMFFTVSLMVVGSAVVIRFITENLQNNLHQVRQAMQEVSNQKAMLDYVGQAIVGCDADNLIIYWNQAATDLFGWRAEEVLGRKYYEVLPAQMSPDANEAIRAALTNSKVWSGEIKIKKKDQSEVPVIGTIAPLYGEQGTASGWIGIVADLTVQKEVEHESKRRAEEMAFLYQFGISLASGEDLYSTLLTLQAEIIQLIQADAFYVAIYDEATDIVSYPIFFDKGKPIQDADRLLHEWPGLSGAVIFSGKTLYLKDMHMREVEETYHPQDSGQFAYQALHSFLGIPLKSNERVIGMLSVQSNQVDAYSADQIRLMENVAVHAAVALNKAQLLERLQIELDEKKRAEEKYRNIFENAIDGIFQSTAQGRFIRVNPAMARMYGYQSVREMVEEVKDISMQMYVYAEQRNSLRQRLEGGELVTDFESLDYRKDGSTFWTSMNVQAIFDDYGNALYYEGTVEDITLRKKVEAERESLMMELEAKNTEMERFTYTVSHDLKSPLVTINGFLGFINRDIALGELARITDDIKRIGDAVNRMQQLLDELLELSRIGRLMNEPEEVPFARLVQDALDIVRGTLDAKSVKVNVEPNQSIVYGDRQRLLEVFQNLIDNAVKYMGDQSDPYIEIGQNGHEGDQPVFFVKDNGMGIEPEYYERIFGLFNKLDPKSEGTGVGLAIVKRILEVHGGRIWVESTAGEGSTFYFTLGNPAPV